VLKTQLKNHERAHAKQEWPPQQCASRVSLLRLITVLQATKDTKEKESTNMQSVIVDLQSKLTAKDAVPALARAWDMSLLCV
jgi:hypothetical protein